MTMGLEKDIKVQNFVIRTIMLKKESFSEKDILESIHDSFIIAENEEAVIQEIVHDSILNFLRSGMIREINEDYYERA